MNNKSNYPQQITQKGLELMLTSQKLWSITAAVGGIRIAQGYWKLGTPITLFCILMYFKRKNE